MSHVFHQSEGLNVDTDGSVQTTITQPCIHIGDWTVSLPPNLTLAWLDLLVFIA